MKKVIEFLNRPLAFPIPILAAFYLYWFGFTPMEFNGNDNSFSALIIGLILFTIQITASIALNASTNREHLGPVIMFIYLPVLLVNAIYLPNVFPRTLDSAQYRHLKYYYIVTTNLEHHSYAHLYRCKKWSFYCESIYISRGFIDARIIVDSQAGEVSLFESHRLEYTDAVIPRYYAGYPTPLNDHLYILGWSCVYWNPVGYCDGDVAYVLYECNMEYMSCAPLPIQYTDFANNYSLDLESDAEATEITLFEFDDYDNPTPIFTYGEHPRCYVEGCEILEP